MKKYLVLVRHSVPEVVEGLPARDWRLSAEGRARAERLAHRLTEFQPEVLVSSTEPKARETAEIVARIHRLLLLVAEDLHEHDRTNVPYMAQDDFHTAIVELFHKPDVVVFGNESADQAHERFARAVFAVLHSHGSKTAAVVAHGTVISLFVGRLIGVSELAFWEELGLPSFVVMDAESNTVVARENNI